MRTPFRTPPGARLLHWTLALVFAAPMAALSLRQTSFPVRADAVAALVRPAPRPYLRVVGAVPLRFRIETPPALVPPRPNPAATVPGAPPTTPAQAAVPAAVAPAATPPVATELPPKAPDNAAVHPAVPAQKAPEPLILDESQGKRRDEEILPYFRFPGVEGGGTPQAPAEPPPSSATYRQQ